MEDKANFINLIKKSLKNCSPENLLMNSVYFEKNVLSVYNEVFDLSNYEKVHVFGSGKASFKMAIFLEKILDNKLAGGLIISNNSKQLKNIKVLESSHPIPDDLSFKSSKKLYEKMMQLSSNDFFIFLLSGGSSSMFEIPENEVNKLEISNLYKILLKSGMDIYETNAVRKCFSKIKGGKFGNKLKASGIVLVISDVLGDDLKAIGSGPLFKSTIDFNKTKEILKNYNIKLNKNMENFLNKINFVTNPNFQHFILGNNKSLIDEIEKLLKKENKIVKKYYDYINGEAKIVGEKIGDFIISEEKNIKETTCYIFGGETSVTVKGNGKGGRNQELALSILRKIKNSPKIKCVCFGSDGIDGFTNASGAYIDKEIYANSLKENLDINKFLKNNDSYTFFNKINGLIKLGQTGNNLLDICIVEIKK